ncbi:MAG TPA: pentapeptide repeat-containing protein [Ktedonobacterales bacterium]|nr:pentapeptide repeat-containing protein [Ktedonobacterales bacterium]
MKIFISYRRLDSAAVAGRLYDRLVGYFGSESVFKDVDSIQIGANFVDVITDAIRGADVMLVLIGRNWLNTQASDGHRRIDDPHDFIRIEIEGALRFGRPIIPVLLDGAAIPSPAELPPSLAQLAMYNALVLRHDPDFSADVRQLISALDRLATTFPAPAPASRTGQPEDTDLTPGPARQAELDAAYHENLARDRQPYQDVPIATRGEVHWILATRAWSGEPGDGERANFSGARFLAPNLGKVRLYGANLTAAILEGCSLEDAVLTEATLDNADLRRARCTRADLRQARLNAANLETADFEGADLSGASLKAAHLTLTNLTGVNLQGATLEGVDLSSTQVSGVVLEGADLHSADLHDLSLEEVSLRGAQLIDANLAGANLRGADLREAVLERAHLESADVSGATMEKANLMGATLEAANFSGVSLVGARLDSVAVLSSMILDPKTRLDHAAWGGVSVREQAPPKNRTERIARYREGARQNRRLAIALRGQGLLGMASTYRLLEQRQERRASLWEGRLGSWFLSWLLDAVAGYGERPGRAFRTYLVVIGGFAAIYFAITHAGASLLGSGSNPLQWYEALVLSLSSFHGRGFFPQTLSLGDPVAVVAASEAVIGLFIELVFIATFSRRFLGN